MNEKNVTFEFVNIDQQCEEYFKTCVKKKIKKIISVLVYFKMEEKYSMWHVNTALPKI